MLNRTDMLELTRRMNPDRSCFQRIAGSYRDEEGYEDGSFNIHFLKLTPQDKVKNLAIAKTIPFAETNERLREQPMGDMQFKRLLDGMRECGLKNDALMENFYELMDEKYLKGTGLKGRNYYIYVFYGAYDIKIKASDKEYQDDSEEVYDFLICAVGGVHGDYEPDTPEYGFLYPSFRDRSSDDRHIAVYKGRG